MNSETLAEPILVGRKKELEELERCLDSAFSGKGITVFISGEAGAGKTRLTTEFLNLAKKKQVAVLTGWCLSDVAVPYFPFIEAFDSYISSNEDDGVAIANQQLSLKTWLTGDQSQANKTFENAYPEAWKDQAFRVVAQELLFLSTKKPLILVLEDIHWADSASLSLLHYLARQVASERILIIATFRSEELNVYVEGHPNPLSKVLLLMGREGLHKEIKLSSLSRDDIRRVAENMLGGLVNSNLVEKLEAYSMGNPLFVVESLRMMHQQGSLAKTNDQWSLGVDNFEIPTKVRDVILRRLDALKSDQRIILDAASVVGENFDPKLIAAAVYQDNAEVLRALNEIAKTTLMIHCDENCCRFGHAKSREMIYEEIPPLLRKEYHSRIAQRIEADQETDDFSINDLAFHYYQAGNKEKAVKYSLQAGQVALSRFSNVEAIKHFTYALKNIAKNLENAEAKRRAQEGLGDAYYANGMYTEAGKIFVALARSESGKVRLRAYRKAIDSTINQGEIFSVMELAKEAEKYAASDRLEAARVLFCKAKAEFFSCELKASLKTSEEALLVFEEEYSLEDAARILYHIAAVYIDTEGLQEKSISLILRTVALNIELEDFTRELEALQLEGVSFFLCGLFEEAINTNLDLLKWLEKIGGQFRHRALASFSVVQDLERRELFADALSQSLKTMEWSKNSASIGLVRNYSLLVIEYARLGDLENAEENFKKLMSFPPEVLATPITGIAFFVALSGAVFFAAKNQWIESNQGFEKAFEELRRSGQSTGWDVLLRQHYSWALQRQGRFEEAKVQLEEVQKLYRAVEERFGQVSLEASLMVHREVAVGEEFEVRLDLVNASKKPGLLVKVEGVIPSEGFKVAVLPTCFSLQNDSVEMKNREIGAFQVVTIKLILQAVKTGAFTLNPKVVYLDELGKNKTSNLKQIKISVKPGSSMIKEERATATTSASFEFKSEVTQKAFDYLVSAFVEDYMRRRIVQEKAGWRSLMRIVNERKLSKSSMYGSRGRKGRALIELESRGLVEARFFPGERGRGGKILKLRVVYENEIIKHLIDNQIMKKKKE